MHGLLGFGRFRVALGCKNRDEPNPLGVLREPVGWDSSSGIRSSCPLFAQPMANERFLHVNSCDGRVSAALRRLVSRGNNCRIEERQQSVIGEIQIRVEHSAAAEDLATEADIRIRRQRRWRHRRGRQLNHEPPLIGLVSGGRHRFVDVLDCLVHPGRDDLLGRRIDASGYEVGIAAGGTNNPIGEAGRNDVGEAQVIAADRQRHRLHVVVLREVLKQLRLPDEGCASLGRLLGEVDPRLRPVVDIDETRRHSARTCQIFDIPPVADKRGGRRTAVAIRNRLRAVGGISVGLVAAPEQPPAVPRNLRIAGAVAGPSPTLTGDEGVTNSDEPRLARCDFTGLLPQVVRFGGGRLRWLRHTSGQREHCSSHHRSHRFRPNPHRVIALQPRIRTQFGDQTFGELPGTRGEFSDRIRMRDFAGTLFSCVHHRPSLRSTHSASPGPRDEFGQVRGGMTADFISAQASSAHGLGPSDAGSTAHDAMHWIPLIESSPVGYAFIDTDSKVIAANDSICGLFGMTKAQLIGRTLRSLIHPDEVQGIVELTSRSSAQSGGASWRARYVRADGATFWGQVTLTPVYDSNGSLIGSGGSIVDVTDDVQAVKALEASERKFRMLASNTGDLVLWIRDGNVLWASPASAQFGWEPADLINQPAANLVHQDDRYLTEVAKQTRDISTEDVRLRFRLLTKTGDSCWVEAHSAPHRGEDGTVDGVISVIRDISAQVAAEQALRDSEREFRLLAENAADIVIRFDEAGVRRWVSGSVRDLLGWEPEQFITAPFDALVHPDDLPNEYLGGERPGELFDTGTEFRIRHGDGQWVWVSKKSRTLIDGSHIEALRCINDEVMARHAAQAAMADLAYRSSHDLLTGLRNRDEVIKALTDALTNRQADEQVAVLFVDIDRFKEVNDGISHAAGDEVLQKVAAALAAQVSNTDCIGRLGGDEFAVVLGKQSHATGVTDFAEQLRSAIARCDFWSHGQRVPVTVSIGVAVSRTSQSAHDMLSDADAALYQAKNTGRNRWELADDSIRAAATRRIGLNGRIRSGIDAGQFHAWYQPIVDLTDRRVLGYEALARWITPDGVIAASEFITAAEDSGMITDLGRPILHEAISRIPFLRSDQMMSVNASASQLESEGFAAAILDQLHATGANPKQLVVEITEHSLLNLEKSARADLLSLTDAGVGIYVDDFGTGYSSLATLLDYPVSGLKLDRAFADRLAQDATGPTSRLVSGLIELTDRLELRGIAEGIETARQESLLRKLGWHCGQGWLFGHAEPPHEYPKVPSMRRPGEVDVRVDGSDVNVSESLD